MKTKIKSTKFILIGNGSIIDISMIIGIKPIIYGRWSCYFTFILSNTDNENVELTYDDYNMTTNDIHKLLENIREEYINIWTKNNIFKPTINLNEYKKKK